MRFRGQEEEEGKGKDGSELRTKGWGKVLHGRGTVNRDAETLKEIRMKNLLQKEPEMVEARSRFAFMQRPGFFFGGGSGARRDIGGTSQGCLLARETSREMLQMWQFSTFKVGHFLPCGVNWGDQGLGGSHC